MSSQPKRVPMYVQLKNFILNQMKNGTWKPGDKLPSENELAEEFKVSRITVKNALADMVSQGIVYRIQGKGTFISDDSSESMMSFEPIKTDSSLIAFLMPRLNNCFTANLMTGIEKELADQGYNFVFRLTHESQELENKLLKELVTAGVSGIMVYPVDGETFNHEILKLTLNHYPLVIVDRYLRGLDTNCVYSDNYGGAYEATKHLTELGHASITFISTKISGTTSIEDRLRGYEQALIDAGQFIDYRLRLLDLGGGMPAVDQIQTYLRENPDVTAIVATNSTIGLQVMKAAQLLNLDVPRDLSIVCFDDYEQSNLYPVPLTYVDQNEMNIGKEAVKLIVSLIRDRSTEPRKLMLPNKLIVRQSTAINPRSDGSATAGVLLSEVRP
ncbi:GntR family transcriptional regulator [Paenibacillus hodogayensis]|uniref:GntR family transcriptional regulator n=1 Tax=Paenibacillus hodogayensis TaxID=279208 RepID=A0ABV5VRA1_9BACL